MVNFPCISNYRYAGGPIDVEEAHKAHIRSAYPAVPEKKKEG